jgi:hypothetical protein
LDILPPLGDDANDAYGNLFRSYARILTEEDRASP